MRKRKYIISLDTAPECVDVPFVCMLLGMHPNTVRKKVREGSIKAFKAGREWRFNREDLKAYMKRGDYE